MRYIRVFLAAIFLFVSFAEFCVVRADDDSSEMLGDAVLGGLLGAGIGAAIGSASGEAGKGAGVGAGVGALSGILLGNMRRSSRGSRRYDDGTYYGRDRYRRRPRYSYENGCYRPGVRRRLVREYDEDGNLISEKEIYYEVEYIEED